MKKFALVLLCLFVPAVQAITIYQIFDAFGSVTDFFISKGSLSEEDERLFNEVAASLGIEHRNIKPRNAGLLLRLITGYNNAMAIQFSNRAYFNAACLQKMTEGQKRFLMGHELAHHQKNHLHKRVFFEFIKKCVQSMVGELTRPVIKVNTIGFDFSTGSLRQYEVDGQGNSPLPYRYFVEGFNFGLEFSLLGLISAQIHQQQESEADEVAMQLSGATVEDAVAALEGLYCPDTQDWPLYAKIQAILAQLLCPVMCLPIIKQHVPHLASLTDRVEHLQSLEA